MPAGEFTSVQFGAMASAEQSFVSIYNQLTSELEDLQRQLESGLSAWTGSARAAYAEAKARWDASAAHMGQVLSQLGAVIGESNTNYQQTEQRLTGMWSG
ncbi:MAG: WXG100 family type VII secretion target [Micromonosporaceae bacterium]